MFRKWRKRWRRRRAIKRLSPRLEEVRMALEAELSEPVAMVEHGSSGRDSVFKVVGKAGTLAALRVNNPHLARKSLAVDQPFQVLQPAARVQREWDCYSAAYVAGLSPQPIWRAADAIACRYVDGQRLFDRLIAKPESFWRLNAMAARALGKLHQLDLVHMDASLANVLADGDQLRFIDFEYGPAAHLSKADMRAYDHLRLVESGIKFAPAELVGECEEWLAVVNDVARDAFTDCTIGHLAPAIGRVMQADALRAKLGAQFPALRFH